MAEGFTILPNFAQQELNTAVIQQDNLPQMILQANAQRYQMNEAERQRNEKELNEQLASTNFDTAGMWEVDLQEVNGDIKGFIDWIKQNPKALVKKADNMELYQQMQQKRNEILFKIGKSKADKIIYEKQQDFINDPRNLDYKTFSNQSKLDNFRNKDNYKTLMDRRWTNWDTPDLWDETAVIKSGRNVMKTTSASATTDYTSPEEVINYIGQIYQTPTLKNQFDLHYKNEYNAKVNKDPNQLVDIYTRQSIQEAKGEALKSVQKKISDVTPQELGESNLIYGLYYTTKDIKQYAPKTSTGGDKSKYNAYYKQSIPFITSSTTGNRVDLEAEGGWALSETSENPRNINIQPPQYAVSEKGQRMMPKEIGAATWNVDIVGVYDVWTDDSGQNFVTKGDKNAAKKLRVVKVVKKTDVGSETYIIPYSDEIRTALENSNVILVDKSEEATSTQSTGPSNKGGASKFNKKQ
jgi:hypothetical protein